MLDARTIVILQRLIKAQKFIINFLKITIKNKKVIKVSSVIKAKTDIRADTKADAEAIVKLQHLIIIKIPDANVKTKRMS